MRRWQMQIWMSFFWVVVGVLGQRCWGQRNETVIAEKEVHTLFQISSSNQVALTSDPGSQTLRHFGLRLLLVFVQNKIHSWSGSWGTCRADIYYRDLGSNRDMTLSQGFRLHTATTPNMGKMGCCNYSWDLNSDQQHNSRYSNFTGMWNCAVEASSGVPSDERTTLLPRSDSPQTPGLYFLSQSFWFEGSSFTMPWKSDSSWLKVLCLPQQPWGWHR